jgi:sec-independent protein translocase protein TatB
MFDVAPTELLLVAVVALVVIGPKDLPRAMRVVGQWVGRARGMARHFRSGIDEMIRHSELEEMEKKWREENERIMREFPTVADPVMLPDSSSGSRSGDPAGTGDSGGTVALPAPATPVGEHDPSLATPSSFTPGVDGDSEQAAGYVAPAMVATQDFANWHGDDRVPPTQPVEGPADPVAEPASPPAENIPPSPKSSAAEEQLSLLPPDPGAHSRPGKPLP